jgi:hypothetical protein
VAHQARVAEIIFDEQHVEFGSRRVQRSKSVVS